MRRVLQFLSAIGFSLLMLTSCAADAIPAGSVALGALGGAVFGVGFGVLAGLIL